MMAPKDEDEFYFDDLPKRSFCFFRNKRNEFCDITFKVGGRSISAHRIILSAAIPFFHKVFYDRETADSEKKEIDFPDIDSDAFESLIDYAYNCKVKISKQNVKMLLSVACVLQMDEVKNACCQFLIDRLNAENVLDIRSHASFLDCPQLIENIDIFIINNFSEIMMTDKFLNISFSLLNKLICSDELNVKNEEVIFECTLKWVKNCPDERRKNLLDLLKNIRFPFLDPGYIRNYVAKEELIRSSPPCRDLVDEGTFYHLVPEERKKVLSFPTSPRRFFRNDQNCEMKDILSVCILFKGRNRFVRSFDLANKNWMVREIKGEPLRLSFCHAVAALDKKMYCFLEDVTKILDLETNTYSTCEGMRYPRIETATVAHENKLFLCGGYEGKKASNVVECFDPQIKDFIKLTCMNTCRGKSCAAAYQGFIYVLGGSNDGILLQGCTKAVEKYNIQTGLWNTSAPMLTARFAFGCCTLNDKMYVCGGYTQYLLTTTTAEVFDFITNQWTFIASMNNLWRRCKLVSSCNNLYAFGDCNRVKETPNFAVEVYQQEMDKWIRGPAPDEDLEVVGAAVIALPSQ